jgi:hypothetical protein
MAWNRNRGALVDLAARRAVRKRQALAEANRGMLQAEEALFELLRLTERAERRKEPARPSKRAKPLQETSDLPAIDAAAPRSPEVPDPPTARILPFRRVRAA